MPNNDTNSNGWTSSDTPPERIPPPLGSSEDTSAFRGSTGTSVTTGTGKVVKGSSATGSLGQKPQTNINNIFVEGNVTDPRGVRAATPREIQAYKDTKSIKEKLRANVTFSQKAQEKVISRLIATRQIEKAQQQTQTDELKNYQRAVKFTPGLYNLYEKRKPEIEAIQKKEQADYEKSLKEWQGVYFGATKGRYATPKENWLNTYFPPKREKPKSYGQELGVIGMSYLRGSAAMFYSPNLPGSNSKKPPLISNSWHKWLTNPHAKADIKRTAQTGAFVFGSGGLIMLSTATGLPFYSIPLTVAAAGITQQTTETIKEPTPKRLAEATETALWLGIPFGIKVIKTGYSSYRSYAFDINLKNFYKEKVFGKEPYTPKPYAVAFPSELKGKIDLQRNLFGEVMPVIKKTGKIPIDFELPRSNPIGEGVLMRLSEQRRLMEDLLKIKVTKGKTSYIALVENTPKGLKQFEDFNKVIIGTDEAQIIKTYPPQRPTFYREIPGRPASDTSKQTNIKDIKVSQLDYINFYKEPNKLFLFASKIGKKVLIRGKKGSFQINLLNLEQPSLIKEGMGLSKPSKSSFLTSERLFGGLNRFPKLETLYLFNFNASLQERINKKTNPLFNFNFSFKSSLKNKDIFLNKQFQDFNLLQKETSLPKQLYKANLKLFDIQKGRQVQEPQYKSLLIPQLELMGQPTLRQVRESKIPEPLLNITEQPKTKNLFNIFFSGKTKQPLTVKSSPGWDAIIINENGKKQTVAHNLPPNRARNIVADLVDNDPSNSFILKKSGKQTKEIDDTSFNLNLKFRGPKGRARLPAGSYVEKNLYRIDTLGEYQGITLKGLKAKRLNLLSL